MLGKVVWAVLLGQCLALIRQGRHDGSLIEGLKDGAVNIEHLAEEEGVAVSDFVQTLIGERHKPMTTEVVAISGFTTPMEALTFSNYELCFRSPAMGKAVEMECLENGGLVVNTFDTPTCSGGKTTQIFESTPISVFEPTLSSNNLNVHCALNRFVQTADSGKVQQQLAGLSKYYEAHIQIYKTATTGAANSSCDDPAKMELEYVTKLGICTRIDDSRSMALACTDDALVVGYYPEASCGGTPSRVEIPANGDQCVEFDSAAYHAVIECKEANLLTTSILIGVVLFGSILLCCCLCNMCGKAVRAKQEAAANNAEPEKDVM